MWTSFASGAFWSCTCSFHLWTEQPLPRLFAIFHALRLSGKQGCCTNQSGKVVCLHALLRLIVPVTAPKQEKVPYAIFFTFRNCCAFLVNMFLLFAKFEASVDLISFSVLFQLLPCQLRTIWFQSRFTFPPKIRSNDIETSNRRCWASPYVYQLPCTARVVSLNWCFPGKLRQEGRLRLRAWLARRTSLCTVQLWEIGL